MQMRTAHQLESKKNSGDLENEGHRDDVCKVESYSSVGGHKRQHQ